MACDRVLVPAVIFRRSRHSLLPIVSNDVAFQILRVTQMFYLGTRLRFVIFGATRVELQWLEDDNTTWTVQSVWGSSAYPES